MDTAEAYEEINQFCTEKLKDFNYYIIAAISKVSSEGALDTKSFTFSNITGATLFAVVKATVSNILSQANVLVGWYQPPDAQPLFKTGEGEKT